MTERLYYKNMYLKKFDAEIRGLWQLDEGKVGIVLSQTLFSPRGGGQLGDKGTIHRGDNEYEVMEVIENEGEIVHICNNTNLTLGERIIGIINWDRRFDLMQQHTGQHIL